MARHNDTGEEGEVMAVAYLTEKGYQILHRNWRQRHWEVDIIANKQNVLHFFEVKTRRNRQYGFPEDSVDNKKIRNLIRAAEEYLHIHPTWTRIQFNILSITLYNDQPVEYFLIEDVYL